LTDVSQWRRCSACKKPIEFSSLYWVCSVSTCNRKRTGLAFCSVDCWEVHLPTANHREAWAVERTAPSAAEQAAGAAAPARPAAAPASRERAREERSARRTLVRPGPTGGSPEPPAEVLIIASRLRDYIRQRSGFNTSDRVLEPLSVIVRRVCDEAIRNASRDGRRTVLDRDIPRG